MVIHQEKGFKLNDQQKIKFGKLAIAQLAKDNPKFPANLEIDETASASMIFADQRAENTLAFTFEDYNVECYSYFIGYPSGNYSAAVQPLYLNYMCQTFGEPYREKALVYWQQQATATNNDFQKRKSKELAKLTAKLDREAQKILDKQTCIFNALAGNEPQKLAHFAAPQITPKTNATAEQDREL